MKIWTLLITVSLLLAGCSGRKGDTPVYLELTGVTMGVIGYNITLSGLASESYQLEIDSILTAFNNSLSTYVATSEISDLNADGDLTFTSPFMYPVLKASREVFRVTSGAFDPTVGPLVNLWGFGPNKEVDIPDSAAVTNALALVGFENVTFDEESVQQPAGVNLDFSAVAKGYAVDLVADFLESREVKNYFVEIGGEVRCKGINKKGKTWVVGITNPLVNEEPSRTLAAVARLENGAVATSGNYRNFYEIEGTKYAHTISPYTGYPVTHSILSASVFASSCMVADAYATAFMVLGVEKAKEIAAANRQIDVHLIYAGPDGELLSYTSKEIEDAIITK